VTNSFTHLPVTVHTTFFQLINGSELILHQDALQAVWITKLEEQVVVMATRKTRKQKYIQQGSTIGYGKAAVQVVSEASVAARQSKKACSGGDQERAQPSLQHCRNCGRTRRNARMCKKDTEASFKSDASTMLVGSLFYSNEIEES
jgi:hypothetical protein